jgi:PIN domain nuclease of toxin-antitoxin system
MTYLLDTHVLLWWLEDRRRLVSPHRRVIGKADPGRPLGISDISLWEIAVLHELRRIRLTLPLGDWLEKATAQPLIQRHGISPAIAAEVASLPATFHRDPVDRIIVATARVLGATLLTSDERIAESGIVRTL